MNIAVVYVFASVLPKVYEPYARRFALQYVKHPPGEADHELHVVVNGPPITPKQEELFSPLAPRFMYHDNNGRDVGAHRIAAQVIPADLMIFLGGPVWPGREGWLDLILRAYLDNGPALYGAFCFHEPAPHVRTTAYWAPPEIINSHDLPIGNDYRYEWEHGSRSITRHTMKLGFPVLQVTWNGVYNFANWTHVHEKDCVFFDQHSERIGYGFGW